MAISSTGNARVLRARTLPGHWLIETKCDRPARLVIFDGILPGWQCRISGVETHVVKTNDQYMSVLVPAGNHQVESNYRPTSFFVGAVVSCIGLAISASLGFTLRIRSR
jgi:hypothetical protein